jgi:hypothetical protein
MALDAATLVGKAKRKLDLRRLHRRQIILRSQLLRLEQRLELLAAQQRRTSSPTGLSAALLSAPELAAPDPESSP